MKVLSLLFLCLLSCFLGFGQVKSDLPLMEAKAADTTKPLIVYISGDGGFNSFTTIMMRTFNSKGYSVIALNAKEYFWNKKTPEKTTQDISKAVAGYLQAWRLKSFLLTGYSFGADVVPFIYCRLPGHLSARTKQLVMVSPSPATVFEIKISDMLNIGKSKGQSVVAEVNKVNKPILFVFGDAEKTFPIDQVRLKNKEVAILPGGHHYKGNAGKLALEMVNHIH